MKNFISLQASVLILGVFLYAISVLTNILLYSSFSDNGLYKSVYSGMGLAFDLSKLCLSLAIGILIYAYRAYIFAAIASTFWTILTVVSIASAFGFMAVVNNAMESKALVASTAFKSLNAAVESAQIRVDSLSLYADPTSASQSAIKIKDLNTQLDDFKNGPAKNSRGQHAGSITSRVGDCSKNGYYSRAYCPKIKQFEKAIAEQERIVNSHNQYLSAVVAKEARLKELSGMNVGNSNITGHLHPMFIGLAALTGATALYIKYVFLCVSSILCELLGSFMLVLYSRLGVNNSFDQSATEYAKHKQTHNYNVNTTATQSASQNTPIPVRSISSNATQSVKTINDGAFIALCDDIKGGEITNLSYKSIQKWGRTKGFKLDQPRVKKLRDTLNAGKIAIYDHTNKLIVV